MFIKRYAFFAVVVVMIGSCDENSGDTLNQQEECYLSNSTDQSLKACNNTSQQAGLTASYTEMVQNDIRTIVTNGVPDHNFGAPINAINGNMVTLKMDATPSKANTNTSLLGKERIDFQFGVGLNGVKLDPEANFPFTDTLTGDKNFDWVLEALNNTSITSLDCNHGHLQADGTYHYHGDFVGYANAKGIDGNSMVQIAWAADGFPVYYKYAYSNPNDSLSSIVELQSSYALKTGDRPGDGISAPCGNYTGKYSQDYGYTQALGDLDECNGRAGVTPEFPGGTYYYVITKDFPIIPRCFWGTPHNSFRIGG